MLWVSSLPFGRLFLLLPIYLLSKWGNPATLGYQLRFAGLSGPRDKPTSHAGLGDLRGEPGTEMFNGVWGSNENRLPKERRISKSQKKGVKFLSSALVAFFSTSVLFHGMACESL